MSDWEILYTKQGLKDKKTACRAGFRERVGEILSMLERGPFAQPCEKLVGDLSGLYSRRLNIQHRVVYKIYAEERAVVIVSMWLNYE